MLKLDFEKWEETTSWVKTYKTLLQKQDLSIEDYDNFLAIKSESITQHQSLAGKRHISEEIKMGYEKKFMQAATNLFTILLNKEKDVLHQRSSELDLETDRLKKENEDKKNLIFGVKKEIETASGEIKAIIKALTPAMTGSHLISMPGMIPPPPPAPMRPRNLQVQPGKSKQELPDSENKKSEMRISVDQLTAIKLKPARPPVMEKTITTESNESPALQIRDLSRQLSEKFLSIESNRREGSINKPKPQISVTDIQARLNANSLKIYEKEQVIASLHECNKAQNELYNSLVLQREQLKKVKKEVVSLKEEQQKKFEEEKQKQETLSIPINKNAPPPPPLPLARKTVLQQGKSKPVAQSNLTDKKKESVLSMEKGKLNNRDFLKQDLEKALVRRRVYLTDETNDENWQSDLDDESSKRAFMIEQEKKKKEEQKQAIIAKYEKAAETHFQQHPAEFSAKKAVEIKIESLRKEIKLLSASKLLVEFEDQIQQLIEKLKQKEEQVAINSSEVNEEPQESVPVPMQQETIIDAEPPVVSALLPAQTEELKEDNGCLILDEALKKASKRLADLPKGISDDLIKLRDYKIRKQIEINTISFSSAKEASQYENELITFYRKAIEIRLSNEAPEMQRQKLLQTAHDVFKPRDQGKRFFADVLMMLGCLVIAGLVVGVARKCTGNSFFFSNAPTRRESDFRAMLNSASETNEQGLLGASPAA